MAEDLTYDEHTLRTTSACAVLMAVSSTTIIFRAWARLKVQRSFGLDDGLILVSWMFLMTEASCIVAAAHYGLGHPADEVTPENYRIYLILQICIALSYGWAAGLAKMSFAVLYLRLFPSKRLNYLNYCIMVFVIVHLIAETCTPLFRCSPVAKAWTPDLDGSCFDISIFWYITTCLNILEAMVLFIQPIPAIWKLQLPLTKRLGLIFMLSLGILVIAIISIRIKYLTLELHDVHEIAEPLIWSVVEVTALLLCSSLPAIRQVVSTIPRLNGALGLKPPNPDNYQNTGSKDLSISINSRKRRQQYVQAQSAKAVNASRTSRDTDQMRLKRTSGSMRRQGSDDACLAAVVLPDRPAQSSHRQGSIIYTRVPVPDLENGNGETAEIIIGVPASVLRREGTMRDSQNVEYYSPRFP